MRSFQLSVSIDYKLAVEVNLIKLNLQVLYGVTQDCVLSAYVSNFIIALSFLELTSQFTETPIK